MRVERVSKVLNIAEYKRKKQTVGEVKKRPFRPPDNAS